MFEVVSRNVMNVCVHCYRESSRIFQPPQAVQDSTNIDESLRGKWWRPEELGIVDYSSAGSAASTSGRRQRESMAMPSLYNDQDMLVNTAGVVPLIPGLLDDVIAGAASTSTAAAASSSDDELMVDAESLPVADSECPSPVPAETEKDTEKEAEKETEKERGKEKDTPNPKLARCKGCGLLISRDMEAIEAHMEECTLSLTTTQRTASVIAPESDPNAMYTISPDSSSIAMLHGNHKQLAGIMRKPELAKKFATRIIYRTARAAT